VPLIFVKSVANAYILVAVSGVIHVGPFLQKKKTFAGAALIAIIAVSAGPVLGVGFA
jgi:hypothetical protein